MATTVRQPKPTKKGFPRDNPSKPNRSVSPSPSPFTPSVPSNISAISNCCGTAWGGARSSPSFSPSPNNARLPNGPPPATFSQTASFPLGEGVTTGVTLRDVKELGALDAPVKSPLFIALTSNESCLHTQATLLTSFNWRLCKCPCYHPDHLTPLFS